MRKSTTKKKLILSLITCIAVLAFLVVIVYAVTLSQYQAVVTYQMDSIDIGLYANRDTDIPLDQLIGLENLAPASSPESDSVVDGTMVVRNLDEQPVYCRMFFGKDDLKHPLAEVLHIAIREEGAEEYLYNGLAKELLDGDIFSDAVYLSAAETEGSTKTLVFYAWLDSSADNTYNAINSEKISDDMSLVVEAVQAKNQDVNNLQFRNE